MYYSYTSQTNIGYKRKLTNTYNNTGQYISQLYQEFTSGNFVNSGKTDFFYSNTNTSTPLNKMVNYGWDANSNKWLKTDSIITFVFQSWVGNLDNSIVTSYIYRDSTGTESADTLSYDTFNNQTKLISYKKVGNGWVYESTQTNSYVYDLNNNITQEIELIYSNGNAAIIEHGIKKVYSDFQPYVVSGIFSNEAQNSTVSIFPNPNNGVFQITSASNNLTSIDVFNTLGTNVYSAKNLKEVSVKEINISGLPKGVYFIKFNEDAKTYTKKMVLN